MHRLLTALACMAAVVPCLAAEQFVDREGNVPIDSRRGVDRRVDYTALTRFGPWDDRNYQLTATDLLLLSPDEATLNDLIPAFFRVAMRRESPALPRSGPAQYPRHAAVIFRQMFGGFMIDGSTYRGARRQGDRFFVELGTPIDQPGSPEPDALSGDVRITTPNGAAESAIKIHPTDPNKVIAGTNGPVTGQDMWWSSNGGSTWTRVSLPLGGMSGDPTVDWSSTGQYAYTTTLGNCGFSGCQNWFYRSADNGQTWTSLQTITPGDPRREFGSGTDKEYMHVDKAAASTFKDRIYVAWHQGNVQYLARSADFGNTFTTLNFGTQSEDRGIGSDITTGPNGHVYYFWPGINNRTIRMRKSTDGGVTFPGPSTVVASTQDAYDFALPAMSSRRAFIYCSAEADLGSGPFAGSIYVAWTDNTNPESSTTNNHGRIQVARSRDGGATWQVNTPHETADQATVDRFHPWLGVGPDGKVHVIYYDTRRDASRQSVDVFYSFSSDGAVSWSTPQRVTAELSPGIEDGFEWGDYNGLDIVGSTLIAIFTDNRNESGGTADSVDVYGNGITPGSGPVCGNGAIEGGEVCDGSNLGGQTCVARGCTGGGVLSCTPSCSALDTSSCVGCPGSAVGTVPDGRFTGGALLQVNRSGATDIILSWGAACGGNADDYAVYEGDLNAPSSLLQRFCSTGGATTSSFTPAAGARYYLAVGKRGGNEGSYGKRSNGTERTPAASACLPQLISTCP